MTAKNSTSRRPPPVALSAIFAGLLFFAMTPNIEENRWETRIALAYRTVCKIAKTEVSDATNSEAETSHTDPWGQPYRVIKTTDGLIVMSTGPNESTLETRFDNDDIYSSMTNSPIESIHDAKRRQLLLAFSVPVIWLLGSIAYLKTNTRIKPKTVKREDPHL